MGSCDVLHYISGYQDEQIMNIEEEVLYISLIFQIQILLFIHILECRSDSIQHNPTFHFSFIVVEPA